MTLFMLDTNIASAALRGSATLDMRLQNLAPENWCISAITRAEMMFGLALKPEATRLAQYVNAFLLTARTEPWTHAAADNHGRIRAHLEKRGKHIGDFDEMIAAHALALGAVLVTDNTRHFNRVEGLRLENWIRPR